MENSGVVHMLKNNKTSGECHRHNTQTVSLTWHWHTMSVTTLTNCVTDTILTCCHRHNTNKTQHQQHQYDTVPLCHWHDTVPNSLTHCIVKVTLIYCVFLFIVHWSLKKGFQIKILFLLFQTFSRFVHSSLHEFTKMYVWLSFSIQWCTPCSIINTYNMNWFPSLASVFTFSKVTN